MLKHSPWEMNQLSRHLLAAACLGLLTTGCDETATGQDNSTADALERELDTQLEVMYQTQEVLRYMDEEERLAQQHLARLGMGDDNESPAGDNQTTK
jgi:hypothetical protein